MPFAFPKFLDALLNRRELSAEQVRFALHAVIAGEWGDAEVAAWLVAHRLKGETAGELTAAALVVRERMIPLETGRSGLLDTCGTGGKAAVTINVSTAAALVAAGAGVPVVKHGNHAVGGRCGSADVLAALGVAVDGDAKTARRCLQEAGMAFCCAPRFHPAWHRVAAVRRRLGMCTLFNTLGPLANPAQADYQLLGVDRAQTLGSVAGALARLGVRQALVVCSRDGLDEVSLDAPTDVRLVRDGKVQEMVWRPEDFGLGRCRVDELRVAGAEESAECIHRVLDGQDGPHSRMILANAAAALVAAQRADLPASAVRLAQSAVAEGHARSVLERLIRCSHAGAGHTKETSTA